MKFDPDKPFIIVFIEENKSGQLQPYEIKKNIASIPFDKFFDYFSCIEEDTIWWSFNIKDFICKKVGRIINLDIEKIYSIYRYYKQTKKRE